MSLNMNFTIETDAKRRVITEKIYGIWKKETAEKYHKEYMEEAKPLLKGKWAKVINLCNWKPSYPEVIDIVSEHLDWCRANGMVLSINIIDNPLTINQLKKMFQGGGTSNISRVVKTAQEGEKILRENGF